jgi:hypothetical protein
VAALLVTACGSGGPATTESGALENLQSVITAYNATTPTDVATTGSACEKALKGLQNSSLLAVKPTTGKDLTVRQDLHAAYLEARAGFSDCTNGAQSMNYVVMARANAELVSANASLQKARSPRG